MTGWVGEGTALTVFQQSAEVGNGYIGSGNIRAHHQRMVGKEAHTATVQHHQTPDGVLSGLQLPNDLLQTDQGVFSFAKYHGNQSL